jgi:protein-S-isoprenylcysteine O-methyltransferase Ste14
MDQKISKFVFKNRRYIHIATAVGPILFKYFLGGTSTPLLWIAGFILMLAGITFRAHSAGYLAGTHTTTTVNAGYVCTSGPFAYIRNPLYLGNFIIGLSLCIAFNEWYGYLVFALHFISVYSIIIPYEERFLTDKFGARYTEYRAHVRRFLPGLKPFQGGTPVASNFKLGISSEKYYLLILILIFAILYFLFVR